MSDISLPPEQPKKKTGGAGLRTLLMILALFAPLPVLINAITVWQDHWAPEAQAELSPFEIVRNIVQDSGDPPAFLAALALLPSLALLMVLGRTPRQRVLAVTLLLLFSGLEIALFMHFGNRS
ncbi:MAG TPA: hypothetical protein VEF76_12690 [Patescibacteria group bacterium]|nr:hypothetical protein [Patescibacteria group bacterium]